MRPLIHFTAANGWINDPHGITWRDDHYEAFYQYVPHSTVWQHNCHWGHASGPDLLSLGERGVAIAPGEGDDGIWTGSLVTDDEGSTRIFYTATTLPNLGIGRIRVATPADASWDSWFKGDVVVDVPEGLDIIAFRDPFIRRTADGWQMFVGAGSREGTAMALEYRSPDLVEWEYAGVALSRSTDDRDPWLGALWECPQFEQVAGADVMVSSVWDDDVLHYAGYSVGDFSGDEFVPAGWGRLTYGPSYYAPSLFYDAEGRPCLLFWMRGVRDEAEQWASAHSVPFLLDVEDGELVASPHPDVAKHRGPAAEPGLVDAVAADIEWRGGEGGVLVIEAGASLLATVRQDGPDTVIEVPGVETTCLPVAGDVRVILDGPVLEVAAAGKLFGTAIAPWTPPLRVHVTNGTLDVFPLR